MKIDVDSKQRMKEFDGKAILQVKALLTLEGSTDEDKEEIRKLWKKIDTCKDSLVLLDVIRSYEKKRRK